MGKNSEHSECKTAGGVFEAAAFRLLVLCHEYDDSGLLEQPTAQTRQRMIDIRWEMWVGVEDIYTVFDVAPELEVVSICFGALLRSCSGEQPSMEDWLEHVRQEVGV